MNDQEKHDEIKKELNKFWGQIIYGIGIPDSDYLREHISYMIFHKALTLATDMSKVGFKGFDRDDPNNKRLGEEMKNFFHDLFQADLMVIKMKGWI